MPPLVTAGSDFMARVTREKHSRLGRTLGFFLLLNILPLGFGLWLLYRHLSGELPPLDVPAGFTFNLQVLGGTLLALVLVASLSLPAAHRAVRGTERTMINRRALLMGRARGSRLLSLLLLPPLALFWALGATARMILVFTALFLIAVTLVFMARLFRPDLLQGPLEQILAWRPL